MYSCRLLTIVSLSAMGCMSLCTLTLSVPSWFVECIVIPLSSESTVTLLIHFFLSRSPIAWLCSDVDGSRVISIPVTWPNQCNLFLLILSTTVVGWSCFSLLKLFLSRLCILGNPWSFSYHSFVLSTIFLLSFFIYCPAFRSQNEGVQLI